MLNGRAILLGILCVIFVAAAFGQEPSDSHIITVTKKIDVAQLNENVEDLTKTVKDLTKTIENLDTTVGTLNATVGELKTTVARIDERTKGISNWQYVILAGIFGPLLLSVYDRIKQNSENKTTSIQVGQSETTPTNPAQVSQSEATPVQTSQDNESEPASTNLTQVRQREPAPTPTLSSKLPDGEKELTEYLKSYSPATKEKV
jgi:hypothetical protein